MYPVPRSDTTSEVGKKTNTHCEHQSGPAASKLQGSTMEHQGTAHGDREAHIYTEMYTSITSFPLVRLTPFLPRTGSALRALGSDSSPSVLTQQQDPVPFLYPFFFVLNIINATWQNGNLTYPTGFPGSRHCVGCHYKDWVVSTFSKGRIMIHSFSGKKQVRERLHVRAKSQEYGLTPPISAHPLSDTRAQGLSGCLPCVVCPLPCYNRSSSMTVPYVPPSYPSCKATGPSYTDSIHW